MSIKNGVKYAGMGLGRYLLLALAVFALAGLGFAVKYVFWPAEKKLERKVMVESHQYKEGAQEAIVGLVEEWRRLEVDKAKNAEDAAVVQALSSQQAALAAQIRRKIKNLDPAEIPSGAQQFAQ